MIIATACVANYTGALSIRNGNPGYGWTLFNDTYVANSTQPTLIFSFENDNQRKWWLDGVSVVDVNASNTQLLQNPSFDNSSSIATGWTTTQGCCYSNATSIVSTVCTDGTYCLYFYCGPENAFGFLTQTFAAVVGHTYAISYYLKASGSGGQPTYCAVSVI